MKVSRETQSTLKIFVIKEQFVSRETKQMTKTRNSAKGGQV
jgi:hypothetical protein